MAKMLMGQIDHARKRLAEIKAEKLGASPADPEIKGKTELHSGLLDGTITVSPTALKNGFVRYTAQTPIDRVKKDSGTYRNNYTDSYSIRKCVPGSIDSAIADEYFYFDNVAEIERFEAETELYKLRKETLRVKSTFVEDAIVLGDQQLALVALRDFIAFEV